MPFERARRYWTVGKSTLTSSQGFRMHRTLIPKLSSSDSCWQYHLLLHPRPRNLKSVVGEMETGQQRLLGRDEGIRRSADDALLYEKVTLQKRMVASKATILFFVIASCGYRIGTSERWTTHGVLTASPKDIWGLLFWFSPYMYNRVKYVTLRIWESIFERMSIVPRL